MRFIVPIEFLTEETVITEEDQSTKMVSKLNRKCDLNFKAGQELNQNSSLQQITDAVVKVWYDSGTKKIDSSWVCKIRGSLYNIVNILPIPGDSPRILQFSVVRQP